LRSLPERLIFFVDRPLGRKIVPAALRNAGEEVRIHDEHFPQDAKDEIWLATIANEKCAIVDAFTFECRAIFVQPFTIQD
jgi:hypothetical protein